MNRRIRIDAARSQYETKLRGSPGIQSSSRHQGNEVQSVCDCGRRAERGAVNSQSAGMKQGGRRSHLACRFSISSRSGGRKASEVR